MSRCFLSSRVSHINLEDDPRRTPATHPHKVKRYQIQYPISAYTFPTDVRIHQVNFSDEHIHVELIDGRALTIPLWWIPSLHNVDPEERKKYKINRRRTMIIWDPDECAINDELHIVDYLGPFNGNPKDG